MPTLYQPRQNIPELKGRVRSGLAVVVHSPQDVSGLQSFVATTASLPGEPLENAYRVLSNAGPSLETWPGFAQPSGERTRPIPEPSRAQALYEALDLAARVWKTQGNDITELALALILPRPGHRATFRSHRPSLVLDYGSLRARALAAGGRLREFGVALFPIARSRRQANLVEALRAHAAGMRLPRLESIRSSDLQGKSGVVIFLHGLIATDVGTFDAFVRRIQESPGLSEALLLVSWPHDTVDPIDLNAEQLSEVIEDRLGPSSVPIAFVCHSRGGLVARRTAVELIEVNAQWQQRLRGCVTFGTPHEGAELAERGDELLGKVLLLLTVGQKAGYVPLVDALWTVRNRDKLPGIKDLRPRTNGGKFLRQLRRAESRLTKKAGGVPIPLFAVGGNATVAGILGWASRRFFGNTPNDLVVTLPSTIPSTLRSSAETNCDHFGYFAADEMRKAHAEGALQFLADAFGLRASEARESRIRPSTKRSTRATRPNVRVLAPKNAARD